MKKMTLTHAALSVLLVGGNVGTRSPCELSGFSDKTRQFSTKQSQDLTAGKQPNAKADRMLAASVRKEIAADKGPSLYAHSVKIIVHGDCDPERLRQISR